MKVSGMTRFFGFSLLTVLALGSGLAEAGQIAITNASFESQATNGGIAGSPTGWTLSLNSNGVNSNAGGGIYNPYLYFGNNAFYNGANSTSNPANGGAGFADIDGENLAFLYEGGKGSGFSQTLSSTLAANTSYTLTVSVGHRNGIGVNSQAAASLGSQIELLAGSTVIAVSSVDSPASGFTEQTVTLADSSVFSAHYGETLSIRLSTTLDFTSTNQATDWDNVRLSAQQVPEPSGLALAGLGALGLIAIRSKRRNIRA